MRTLDRSLLRRLLVLLMQPIAKFCVRHSLRLQDVIDCAKVAFVQVGRERLQLGKKKVNVSRLSAMTGVHRRDAIKLLNTDEIPTTAVDLVTKVVGHWQTDERYLTKQGLPRILKVAGEPPDFTTLVQSLSSDVSPATVLFELQRVGAIESARGGIRLMVGSYVPQGDVEGTFRIASRDVEDLIRTVEANGIDELDPPHFHARTEYDKVRPEAAGPLKRWFLKEGHLFHMRAREFISRYDQDVNPDPKFSGKPMRVVLTGFSFIDNDENGDA